MQVIAQAQRPARIAAFQGALSVAGLPSSTLVGASDDDVTTLAKTAAAPCFSTQVGFDHHGQLLDDRRAALVAHRRACGLR